MTITRKIFLTNTIFICAALSMLMLVNTVILRTFSNHVQPGPPEINKLFQDSNDFISSLELDTLQDELADSGYELLVVKNTYRDTVTRDIDEQTRNINAFNIINLVSSLLTILILCLISLYVSNRLKREIMIPLNLLSSASKRVKKQDWSQLIQYKNKDEYTEVCNSFDEMLLHLQEEEKRKSSYEHARTEMIAGISHDLRTPLTSVRGYLKGIMDGVASTVEKQQQYISIAYRKACEMDILLQKLFDLSTIEFGKMPMNFQETEFISFTKNYIKNKKEQPEHEIHFQLEHPAHPISLWIDQEQIHRILENLTENAMKYCNDEDLKISIQIKEDAEFCILEFSDNGQGVSEEDLPFLFQRFWRADKSRENTATSGNGLGLSITKHVMKAHHGSVYAKSENGLTIGLKFRKNTLDKEK